MNNTKRKTEVGLNYMEHGKLKAAIKCFESAVRVGDGSKLERDIAAWWMVNTVKYRKEWKKRQYGNAHLFWYDDENNGKAWSDLDIAVVLSAPDNKRINGYLVKFLGRSPEAIRFQKRYAHGRPLKSWTAESGERYTRFTQNSYIKSRLGV